MSRSTKEAKYRAMTTTTCEITWLKHFLQDLIAPQSKPSVLYCDNQVTLHIATNPIFHVHTKFININCHLVQKKLLVGSIKTLHVSSGHQLADILTKPLGLATFYNILSKMLEGEYYVI